MIVLGLLSMLAGTALGLGRRAIVLVPGVICTLGAVLGIGHILNSSASAIALAAILSLVAFQIGYIIGAYAASALSARSHPRLDGSLDARSAKSNA